MKLLVTLLVFLSTFAHADDKINCTFFKIREVAFTGSDSKDKLEVSIKGKSCKTSKLELKLMSESGELLHSHETSFSRWYWPDDQLRKKALEYANELLDESIGDTSKLTTTFRCEIEEPDCEPYERNLIPMKEYLVLKKSEIPMISHETYYEGWASWVYNKRTNTMIKVYEGGL